MIYAFVALAFVGAGFAATAIGLAVQVGRAAKRMADVQRHLAGVQQQRDGFEDALEESQAELKTRTSRHAAEVGAMRARIRTLEKMIMELPDTPESRELVIEALAPHGFTPEEPT